MANLKISALTAGDPALSTDQIPIARSGANFKLTAGSIAALGAINFADSEVPSGTINSSNVTFTLAHTPNPAASVMLVQAGSVLLQGTDYTLSTATITMTTAPVTGDTLVAWYRY